MPPQHADNQITGIDKGFMLAESMADLHLGHIDMDEWVTRLAQITECVSATAISWCTGRHLGSLARRWDAVRSIDAPRWSRVRFRLGR